MPPWNPLPKPTPLTAAPAKNIAADLTVSASSVAATPATRAQQKAGEMAASASSQTAQPQVEITAPTCMCRHPSWATLRDSWVLSACGLGLGAAGLAGLGRFVPARYPAPMTRA